MPAIGTQPRLVILGLDGASWDIINPMMAEGKLPAIQGVVDEGQSGVLKSVIPPVTAPAWATMLTGVNPGEHGVFAMTMPDPTRNGMHRPVCMTDWRAKPLWALLNERGLTTGFMGVPFTFPPPRVNGWLISGIMGTPRYDARMFSPGSLYAEVTAAAGTYPLDPPTKSRNTMPFDLLQRQIDWIRDATLHLLAHRPVDVLMVVENYTDHVAHSFFQTRVYEHRGTQVDLIEHAYRAADELVGSVRERVGADTPIVLVSDHGMGALKGYINIEAALNIRSSALVGRTMLRMAWRGLTRLLPASATARLKTAFFTRPKAARAVPFGEATISVSGMEASIRVLTDDPDLRRRTVEQILAQLRSLKRPTDGQAVFEPYAGETLFHGPHLRRGPDAIAWPAEQGYEHLLWAPQWLPLLPSFEEVRRAGVARAQAGAEGAHRLDGVFMTNLRPDGSPIPTRLEEVVGYCLHALGDEAPVAEEGEVAVTTEAEPAYSDDDQGIVEQRLADLGYL
jgi:predicted AlkP superfamily phosphohydrolase/phosphomutase